MVTPTLLQVPNSDEMSEGALPLHQSPLGSSVQVGLSRVTPEAADPVPSQGWVAVGGAAFKSPGLCTRRGPYLAHPFPLSLFEKLLFLW